MDLKDGVEFLKFIAQIWKRCTEKISRKGFRKNSETFQYHCTHYTGQNYASVRAGKGVSLLFREYLFLQGVSVTN